MLDRLIDAIIAHYRPMAPWQSVLEGVAVMVFILGVIEIMRLIVNSRAARRFHGGVEKTADKMCQFFRPVKCDRCGACEEDK